VESAPGLPYGIAGRRYRAVSLSKNPGKAPGSVDLNQVAVFLKVVELQSFTAAAEALGLPKSSVSRSVAGLEQSLGVQLLQRTTRTVALTSAGSNYFREAARALAALGEAQATLSQYESTPQGVVRVTAPVDVGTTVLAEAAAVFVRKYPGIQLDFLLTARVINLVDEGVDLAVRAGVLRDSSLMARRVNSLDAWLFAAPVYLESRGTPHQVSDLAQRDCVLFRPKRGTTQWSLVGPDGPREIEVSGPVGADDFTFVREAVLAGAGVGLLPALFCEKHVENRQLVRVLAPYASAAAPLHVVWPASRHVPQRVRLVRDWLVDTLGALQRGESRKSAGTQG
jgi:DNA-binding transcriptional LysR family regulator